MLSFPLKWRVFSFFPALSRSIPHFSNTLSPYIFSGNPVAGVFVVSMILSLTLPKKVEVQNALTPENIEKD